MFTLGRSRSRPVKIMIVDDSQTFRKMIRETLAPISEEIVECSDGQEAVERYAEYLPDWVTMDVEMDRMDGIEATRAIKARHPEAQVMVVTQHNQPEIREVANDAGCCAFVSKDKLSEVRAIIRSSRL